MTSVRHSKLQRSLSPVMWPRSLRGSTNLRDSASCQFSPSAGVAAVQGESTGPFSSKARSSLKDGREMTSLITNEVVGSSAGPE